MASGVVIVSSTGADCEGIALCGRARCGRDAQLRGAISGIFLLFSSFARVLDRDAYNQAAYDAAGRLWVLWVREELGGKG